MTRTVKIGNVFIGGGSHVAVQSMTNTDTKNIDKTVEQILALEKAGCEIVRSSVYDAECAAAIPEIKGKIHIPFVADIHFSYRLAIASIENGADKIRINPGNIGSMDKVDAVIDCARMHKVPIRIGVNSGSLPKDLLDADMTQAQKIAEAAGRHIAHFEKRGFYDIVVSLKSSGVMQSIQASEAFAAQYDYPQHVGITEAGCGIEAVIKSSVGIGSILSRGIGDTIRVSLTGDPVQEVVAAWEILKSLGIRRRGIEIISCPTCARTCIDIDKYANIIRYKYKDVKKPIKVAVMGCVVNGPGESREADVGIAGGKDYSLLFTRGMPDQKVKNSEVEQYLFALIDDIIGEDS